MVDWKRFMFFFRVGLVLGTGLVMATLTVLALAGG